MDLASFAATRGFTEQELAAWDIRVENGVVVIPILGRKGPWYERIHRPGGKPKYESPKGAKAHLYNPLGLGPHSPEVWIAEGEFDTLSLITVGAPALGILGAASFIDWWSLLFRNANIVLALDPDEESNEQATRVTRLASLWPEEQVSRFDPMVQGGYPDLNEWFKQDRSGFRRKVLAWEP